MAANRPRRCEGRWIFGVVTGLLLVLIPLVGAWPEGKALNAGYARQRALEQRSFVTVRHGQLSVDLREAELREVFAEIGRQAGIRMALGPSAGERISAQFTGVELETGIRRLLRLASWNYVIVYAPGSPGRCASTWSLTSCLTYLALQAQEAAAGGAIQEVRVFGEKGEGGPPRPAVAKGDGEESASDTDNPPRRLSQQVQATGQLSPESPPREATQQDENAAASRLRAKAARRLQAISRPAQERGEGLSTPTNPGDDPGQQSEEPGGAAEPSR